MKQWLSSTLNFLAKASLLVAALAKDAVPRIDFHQVRRISNGAAGHYDSALLTANDNSYFVVRVANSAQAGTDQELELRALKALTAEVREQLPFGVTRLVGETKDEFGTSVYVYEYVYGNETQIETVQADSSLSTSIGKAIAAIHNLPLELVQDAHLPEYDVAQVAAKKVAELDRILESGKVPAVLLGRWESAFEDISLFRFKPTVIHSRLSSETVLQADGEVTGILDLTSLHIGDPAEDFAWILGTGLYELSDSILDVYRQNHRHQDEGLRHRATLYNELDIAKWLLHAIATGDEDAIADATSTLELLANDVETGAIGRLAISQPVIEPVEAFETFSAEEFTMAADEDDLEIIDLTVESVEEVEVEVEYNDNKTRPIELPAKTDNELF